MNAITWSAARQSSHELVIAPMLWQRTAIAIGCLCLLRPVASGAGAGRTAGERPNRVVVTDYPDIYAAIEAAKRLRVHDIYIPSGVYLLDKTLNFSALSWAPVTIKDGAKGTMTVPRNATMVVKGAGRTTILVARTGEAPAIDLTGAHRSMILRDFVLQSPWVDDGSKGRRWVKGANVGILMSRMKGSGGVTPSSGGHYFENIVVQGVFSKAGVVSWNSEVNRFVACAFRNRGGDAFIVTHLNREGVKSPYVEHGLSSNVDIRFFGTILSTRARDSVALRICGAAGVSLHGTCLSTFGEAFAAVYIDGTETSARNISFRDVRMECSAGHCLYAVGAVSHVCLEGGDWIATGAENIRHEDRIPNQAGPHRFVAFPREHGRAQNWTIRNLRLSRNFPAGGVTSATRARMPCIRFESLQNSHLEELTFYVQHRKPGEASLGTIDTVGPHIVVDAYSRRNTFEVPSREAVALRGDARGNTIVALCEGTPERVPALWRSAESSRRSYGLQKFYDGGTRRTYVQADAGPSLLNLGTTNVFRLTDPRRGDLTLHDGTGFDDGKPRLAVYDGRSWVFFVEDGSQPRPAD